jgi:PAS domain S-box-containing protein
VSRILRDGRPGRGPLSSTQAAGDSKAREGGDAGDPQPAAAGAPARASEGFYEFLIEHVPDVIWTADTDFRLTYISPSVTRLLGYTPEEALALSPSQSLTASSLDVLKKALAERPEGLGGAGSDGGSARTLELEYVRKDGSTVWSETGITFLRGRDGRPAGILGVTRDATERRQVEQMKTDFVTLTTHQLRTPLTGIKWLLELAVADASISAATQLHIRDAAAAADRLIEIVNNLLDSANLETGTLSVAAESTHLGELTRSVLEELDPAIHDKRCLVWVSGAETIEPVMGDPKLLRQAVLNLVSNAVKYTPPSGRLAIRMWQQPEATVWEIEDNGIGVPREGQSRLFQKFYRADNAYAMAPEGTGLGLYLVRLIIERFGGRAWYRSEEGEGSTFGFTLPREGRAR